MFKGQFIGTYIGIELHEGDIVKYVYHITHGPHEEGEATITYDEVCSSFTIDTYTPIELSSIEIVGTIYNNGEIE
jgi:hypothetical protein